MNKGIRNIAIGVLAYVGFILLSNSKTERKYNQFRLQLKDIDIDFKRIRFIINLQNPTSGNVVIRSIVGEIYINGVKLANVKAFGYYDVKANSEKEFPIFAEFKPANMTNSIMNMLQTRQALNITLTGTMNVNSEPIPITLNYRYPHA